MSFFRMIELRFSTKLNMFKNIQNMSIIFFLTQMIFKVNILVIRRFNFGILAEFLSGRWSVLLRWGFIAAQIFVLFEPFLTGSIFNWFKISVYLGFNSFISDHYRSLIQIKFRSKVDKIKIGQKWYFVNFRTALN